MRFTADVRDGVTIARVEFIRSFRKVRENRRQFIALGVTAFFGFVLILAAIPVIYELGVNLRTSQKLSVVMAARGQMTILIFGVITLFVIRTISGLHRINNEPLMLTTVSSRAIVIGMLGAELARLLANFFLPAILLLGAFVLGAQSPLSAIVIPLVLTPILITSSILGYLVGLSIHYVGRKSPLSSQSKAILWPLLFALSLICSQIVAQIIVNENASLPFESINRTLTVSPVSAYVDLLFLGSPGQQPINPLAGSIALGVVLSLPVVFTAAARIAEQIWIADSDWNRGPESATASATGFGRTNIPRPFRWAKPGRIAWLLLIRISRSPDRLVHLLVPLIFTSSVITPLLQIIDISNLGGIFLQYSPFILPIIGSLFGSSLLCLNPLGDEESMLPVVVLSATDARQLIAARVVTALVIGIPIGVILPIVLGIIGPHSAVTVGFIAIFGMFLTVASGGLAVGLGALIPRYEPANTWGVEAVTPTIPASFSHVFGVGITGIGGALLIPISLTLNPLLFLIYLAILTAIGGIGFQYAVRQARSYYII